MQMQNANAQNANANAGGLPHSTLFRVSMTTVRDWGEERRGNGKDEMRRLSMSLLTMRLWAVRSRGRFLEEGRERFARCANAHTSR